MIHGRTLKQLFSGPIDVDIIKKSKKYFSGIILANGGINNLDGAVEVIDKTGVDGVGIGRGALGQPWIFSRNFQNISGEDKKRLSIKVALKHLKLIKENRGEISFNDFKGHLAWYLKDFIGASELRGKIMLCKNYIDIENILKNKKVLV
jgi:tRNA-dihydrouridine synthase B